jgi:hypothetical protein
MGTRSIQGRQMGFVEDLFSDKANYSIDELREKYKIRDTEFQYWLKDKRFIKEIRRRVWWAYQTSEIQVARFAQIAATKLIELTGSQNPETARKACLDIISLLRLQQRQKVIRHISERVERKQEPKEERIELEDDQASRILSILSEPIPGSTR